MQNYKAMKLMLYMYEADYEMKIQERNEMRLENYQLARFSENTIWKQLQFWSYAAMKYN